MTISREAELAVTCPGDVEDFLMERIPEILILRKLFRWPRRMGNWVPGWWQNRRRMPRYPWLWEVFPFLRPCGTAFWLRFRPMKALEIPGKILRKRSESLPGFSWWNPQWRNQK